MTSFISIHRKGIDGGRFLGIGMGEDGGRYLDGGKFVEGGQLNPEDGDCHGVGGGGPCHLDCTV